MLPENLLSNVLYVRGAERILIVFFAGLSIYFGYRLFLNIPFKNNQAGEIELPGFKVVLSKVGPGIFFAGFGCAVLITSYMHPIEAETKEGEIRGGISHKDNGRYSEENTDINIEDGLEQTRARVQLSILNLNCFPRYAREAQGLLAPDEIEIAVRDAKLSLFREVWDEKSWGDYDKFSQWAKTGNGDVVENIKNIYSEKGTC